MANREYLLPTKSYNAELLHNELLAALGDTKFKGVLGRKGIYSALLTDEASSADETTCTTIANTHNHTQQTVQQQMTVAITINRQQIIEYLKAQLTSATPDTTANIKAQVQAYVNGNAKLQNAMTNIAALYGYNLGTNAGYLQTALIMVALMT
jgi:hypothetical protein